VVLSGDQLEAWVLRRGCDQLGDQQVAAIWDEVDRHAVRRDEHERSSRPMPQSLAGLVLATVAGVLAALCFLLTGQLLELTGSLSLWVVVGLGLVAGAEVARRRTRFRWQARVFQVGISGLYLLTAVSVARAYL
jgi:hypothetical protein